MHSELTVAAVWDRIVDHAVEQRVDALVLTGDVADHDNAFFEAYGHLEKGFRRLVDAGIPIVVVAGNHDVEVLGRLVDALGSPLLHLLGRGGLWETLRLAPEGATPMRLLGWSFRTPHETASPLDHPTLAEALEGHADHEPLVGVLHADLDVAGSRYAPVTTAQLLAVPTGAWLLGHIHVPRLHEPSGRPVLYPGSPQPLDPGETGRRGPWAITVHADGRVEAEMVPMATVRYATWEVPVDGVEDKATLERTLIEALVAQLEACAGEQPSLRHLVARMHLVGRTVLHREIPALASEASSTLYTERDGARAVLDRVEVVTRPLHDVQGLARSQSPAGELARLLVQFEAVTEGALALDALEPSARHLVDEAAEATRSLASSAAYRSLDRVGATEVRSEAVTRLHQQGLLLLDEMLAQADSA